MSCCIVMWTSVHACGHTVYMYVCASMCTCAHVLIFSAALFHSGIVNSLFTKLLNGVTTRAKAFSFFAFIFFPSLPLSLRLFPSTSTCQLITGGRIGNKSFIFHFGGYHQWPAVLMKDTCETRAVRLWKGLTLPFDSTSVPHKTGKATVRLVDYPFHSQMPSNDYLATSKVQWHGRPPPPCSC